MNPKERIAEIEREISHFVAYSKGEKLRQELLKLAKQHYKPKHTPVQYAEFISRNARCFEIRECGMQSQNEPKVFCLFTTRSQHVIGNTLQECLDLVMSKK